MTGSGSFSRFEEQHQRLTVLQLLEQDSARSHSEDVLVVGLAALGHAVSSDRMRSLLAWLAEQGLVETGSEGEDVVVAHLTARGSDVALGRAVVPGVARPRPRR